MRGANKREGKREQTQADESRRERQQEAKQTFPAARGNVRLRNGTDTANVCTCPTLS